MYRTQRTTSSSHLLSTPSTSALSLRDSHVAETPYRSSGLQSSISDKFSLSPDPASWGSNLDPNYAEADDYLHNPEVRGGKYYDHTGFSCSSRGFANLGCLGILILALLALFIGYPVLTFVQNNIVTTVVSSDYSSIIDTNASMGSFGLIDADTPDDAYYFTDWRSGDQWQLVFSDEFNTDGRSFYPGDDPFWEAVDLHYWQTNNLEWYSPDGVTTANGSLVITLSAKETHDLDYQGAMLSTWNKFCFTGGYYEVAVTLPGSPDIVGLWPAIWSMGNLGRAGYGASLDGMWPYTYDSCDIGTVANQSIDGLPTAALTTGAESANYSLSYLPGQRLSRCTCAGQSHPGPVHTDGTYVGRSAPEIDVFEAQVSSEVGYVSQSCQWAPFNAAYVWLNTSDNLIIADATVSTLNSYLGGDYQQATSVVSQTNQSCYQYGGNNCFTTYGFQYEPGFDDSYITWINNGKIAWTLNVGGMAADSVTEISARPIPQEPMYLIANLGMSYNFGDVDLADLVFPAIMLVDYVRVYQDPNNINVGCDPVDFPTSDYINTYYEAYTNPNLTTWVNDYGQTIPTNNLTGTC